MKSHDQQLTISRTMMAMSTAAWAIVCLIVVTVATDGYQFSSADSVLLGRTWAVIATFIGAFLGMWAVPWLVVGTIYFMTFGGFGHFTRIGLVCLTLCFIIISSSLIYQGITTEMKIAGTQRKTSSGSTLGTAPVGPKRELSDEEVGLGQATAPRTQKPTTTDDRWPGTRVK